MVVITALRTHRSDPRRVDVVLDDRRRMTVPAEAVSGLRVGMVLEGEAAETLQARAERTQALTKVGRMLARRPHAVAEVRRRLIHAGFSQNVTDEVVGQLEASGDLDDEAFARAWVENRGAFRPRSAAMIRSELIRKGVGREAIRTALEGFEEREAARAAAKRVAARWQNLDEETKRRRLYDHLARRGFDHETIRSAIQDVGDGTAGPGSEGTQ